jgi:membrane fusion protein, hemolysin D
MNKIPNEAIEFQPDALEIKNRKLPFWVRYSVFSAFIFMAGVIVWACLSQVDVIVQAKGKLASDAKNIVMKPLQRAIIQKINVKIGDVVTPGQVLITFDPTITGADSERLKNESIALKAQFERLKAEFEQKPYRPQGSGNSQKWQYAIYGQRQDLYKEKVNYYDHTLRRYKASKKGLQDTQKKQKERLVELKKIEDMFKRLHEKKAASLKDLIQLRISRMEMESTVDQLENSLIELSHQRESVISAKNSFIKEWRNTLSEQMVKVERELISTQKLYEKNEQLVSSVHMRAPCKAVVHEIAAFSEGSAVREAEPLITLIPLSGTVEMEAEVRPQDIGKVKVGSLVRVKLNAYPFQKHGTLDGKIRNISEDTLRQQGAGKDGGNFYYRAKVTLSGRLRGVPHFRLIPGMEAQVDIIAGRRRIITYLLYPLIKAFDETAREP